MKKQLKHFTSYGYFFPFTPPATSKCSFQNYHLNLLTAPPQNSENVPKSKLCRTAKSIHGIPTFSPRQPLHVVSLSSVAPVPATKGGVSKTLSEKFSNIGMRNYSAFKSGK